LICLGSYKVARFGMWTVGGDGVVQEGWNGIDCDTATGDAVTGSAWEKYGVDGELCTGVVGIGVCVIVGGEVVVGETPEPSWLV